MNNTPVIQEQESEGNKKAEDRGCGRASKEVGDLGRNKGGGSLWIRNEVSRIGLIQILDTFTFINLCIGIGIQIHFSLLLPFIREQYL